MADIIELTNQLTSTNPRVQYNAIAQIHRQRINDPAINNFLVGLLTSHAVAPRDSATVMSLHEPISPAAANALCAIGATDEVLIEATIALLDAGATLNWWHEQASFDQGMYIGEYHSEEVKPAQFACKLARLIAQQWPHTRDRLAAILAKVTQEADSDIHYAATQALKRIAALK